MHFSPYLPALGGTAVAREEPFMWPDPGFLLLILDFGYELPLVPVVVFHNLIEFFFWREISWDGVELRKEPKGIA